MAHTDPVPNCKTCRQPVDRHGLDTTWVELLAHNVNGSSLPPGAERIPFCSVTCITIYLEGFVAFQKEERAKENPHGPH